jgi:hypothetical protein
MEYAAEATPLFAHPLAAAIALMVSLAATAMALEYRVELMVGVVPSIV